MGIKVKISHVPGHVNLMPNEIADREAKKAAEKAKNMDNQEVDIQLIKQVVRKVTTKNGKSTGITPQVTLQDIN